MKELRVVVFHAKWAIRTHEGHDGGDGDGGGAPTLDGRRRDKNGGGGAASAARDV